MKKAPPKTPQKTPSNSLHPQRPSQPQAGGERPSKRGVVLLSGGLDSVTVLAHARQEGYEVTAVSFTYGQRHSRELEAARRQAEIWKVAEHVVAQIDFGPIGGSALTTTAEVPKDRSADEIDHEVPITYVPARNAVFLSYALALAEARGTHHLFIGANAVDFSGYPDCRPAFLEAFEAMAQTATVAGMKGHRYHIHAPLLHLTKGEIVSLGTELGVDYGATWTCYDPAPSGAPWRRCDSCFLRAKGFEEADVPDPLLQDHS